MSWSCALSDVLYVDGAEQPYDGRRKCVCFIAISELYGATSNLFILYTKLNGKFHLDACNGCKIKELGRYIAKAFFKISEQHLRIQKTHGAQIRKLISTQLSLW